MSFDSAKKGARSTKYAPQSQHACDAEDERHLEMAALPALEIGVAIPVAANCHGARVVGFVSLSSNPHSKEHDGQDYFE